MHRLYQLVIIVVVALSFGSPSVFAQKLSVSMEGVGVQVSPLDKSHEIRLNLLSSTLFLRPEVTYEYAFNSDFSAGGRMAFALSAVGVPNQYLGLFSMSPYARWHFYRSIPVASRGTSVRGFFVELNLSTCYYTNLETPPPGMVYSAKDYEGLGLGVGVGIGYKWITPRAWTFELGAYLGRNVVMPPSRDAFYGNYLVSIGKRF